MQDRRFYPVALLFTFLSPSILIKSIHADTGGYNPSVNWSNTDKALADLASTHALPITLAYGLPTGLIQFGGPSVSIQYTCVGLRAAGNGPPVTVLIDTGSKLTWASTSSGAGQSTTQRLTDQRLDVEYIGTHVQMQIAQDSMRVGDLAFPANFGLTSGGQALGFDGLLGLANVPSGEASGPPPMIQQLSHSHKQTDNSLSIQVPRAGAPGQVLLGGASSDKRWVQSKQASAWVVPVTEVFVDGRPLNIGSSTAIIDTGQANLLVLPADAALINEALGSVGMNGANHVIPCSSSRTLQISLGSILIHVSPMDYVGRAVNSGYCQSRVVGGNNDPPWSLGAAFLANVETTLDYGSNRIGFAADETQHSGTQESLG